MFQVNSDTVSRAEVSLSEIRSLLIAYYSGMKLLQKLLFNAHIVVSDA